MAPRSRRPRRKAPKRSNRRRGGNGSKSLPRLPGTLAPQHMLVKLKWTNLYQKSTVANKVTALHQFRLNSIHDPDMTNTTGTSALGLVEWARLYQQYRVYKCAYVVRLTNLNSDSCCSGALNFTNYNDTSFSVSDLMRPMGRRFQLGNKEGENKAVIKGVISNPKLRGVSAAQYKADNNTSSGFQTSPTQLNQMTIVATGTNPLSPCIVAFTVEFTYFVELISNQALPEALDLATGLPVVPEAIHGF